MTVRAPEDLGRMPQRIRSLLHVPRLRTWTLRSRLVLAVVAMMALISIIVGVVSVLSLRGSLMGTLDAQLHSSVERGRAVIMRQEHSPVGPQNGRPSIGRVVAATGQQVGTFGAFIQPDSITIAYLDPSAATKHVARNLTHALTAVPVDTAPRTVDLGAGFGQYRMAAVPVDNGNVLVIGLPMSQLNQTVSHLILVILIVTIAGLFVLAAAGTVIVRLSLSPLDRMTATAQQVSELPLDRGEVALAVRVPSEDTDPHTEVGTMGAALNRMLGHIAAALTARQASEQKVRQFVADASHELRTPLASIRGYAELTRRGPEPLPADATHSLGRIESEATRMTGLVEDLLLLARLDAGRDLEHGPVDLTSLVIDAVGDAHAAGGDHEFSLDLPDEPVEVYGDAARLHQIVTNLLANARVHTPAGTRVTAALRTETAALASGGPEVPTAVLTIADDGPGIPEEQQPHLFERFARGDESRSRATGSTGLGLAIVKAVTDAHGGTVGVRSRPGATAFEVRLPIDAPPPPPAD